MVQPFLLRFKRDVVSPNRAVAEDIAFEYDTNLDQVVFVEGGSRMLAIDPSCPKAPETKKADLEKGEDQKDKRMWR